MLKAIDKWLVPYLRSALRRPRKVEGPIHILFAVCDHFEPLSPHGAKPHAVGIKRVQRWLNEYPKLAEQFRDADGVAPQHTFFYPEEEYHPDFVGPLADLTAAGLGEVEIHLHHRNDTPEGLREKLTRFRDLLREEHGLLGSYSYSGRNRTCSPGIEDRGAGQRSELPDAGRLEGSAPTADEGRGGGGNVQCSMLNAQRSTGNTEHRTPNTEHVGTGPVPPTYGFIHGNWALCNSRPDGDWCGVNEELSILAETGCYADFTFPSVPSPTQPRTVNSIYYATDAPGKPRGHDRGAEAQIVAGTGPVPLRTKDGALGNGTIGLRDKKTANHEPGTTNPEQRTPNPEPKTPNTANRSCSRHNPLLLVQGPLALNWRWRKWGVLPRVEHSDLCGSNPPTPLRADLWGRQHIHVRGKPDWVFIKLHTHGCIESNTDVLLGEPMRTLHAYLTTQYNDGTDYCLHYVTAREMANLIHAAEAGTAAPPGDCRNFIYAPPPVRQ